MPPTQLPLFVPESNWRAPNLGELPSWKGAKRVGFDLETKDPQLQALGPGVRRPGNYVVGLSFAIEDGPSYYLPMRHEGGDNLDPQAVLRYAQAQAAEFEGELCGAHLNYDLDWAEEEGVTFPRVKKFRDALMLEALIDELQMGYRLQDVCERRLGRGKEEQLLREAAASYGKGFDLKKDLWRLPARFVGPYGTFDAEAPLLLLRRQEKEVEEQDLWQIYDLESDVLPILVRMRRRGVRVNFEKLEKIERWCLQGEQDQCDVVRHETGVTITPGDLWKPDALAKPLQMIGVQVPLTPKTRKPSIDKFFLDGIEHPVAEAIQRARKLNKLRTTFAASIRSHAVDGRIHTTFNQVRKQDDFSADDEEEGARFGRLSCVDPNLQQQPARDDELGPMWRDIYEPDEGGEWCSADFSQQEPRFTVHYAVKTYLHKKGRGSNYEDFEKALEAQRRYREDPSTDFHQMMSDFTGLKRKQAKEIFLGLVYGMGGAKLCKKLGLPTVFEERTSRSGAKIMIEVAGPEGREVMNKFDAEVSFARSLARYCETEAAKKGYVTTIKGRRCRFPKKFDGYGFDWCHKALNRLIQGSSADQTKYALVRVEAAGHAVQLQVHDELDLTVRDRRHAEEVAAIMRDCLPLEVPSKVDVEVGPSWGKAK